MTLYSSVAPSSREVYNTAWSMIASKRKEEGLGSIKNNS